MSNYTVLEMVQDVLSGINGDEVNSISDTVESLQVATYLKEVYENLVAEYNLPVNRKLIMLDASGDVNKPTHMRLPNTVRKLDWIRYDRRLEADDPLRYDDITYLSPEEFTARVLERSSEDADVLTVTDFSGAKLLIRTDKGPDWWTSFDDTYVVFDSYDSDVDSTLQQSKTMAYGAVGASWTMTDTFEPDLPEHLFPILKAETLARAALRHNQMPDATAERDSRRLRIGHIKRGARAAMPPHPYPDYGRK